MNKCAGRVLMLVQSPYPQDVRVRNEATLLVSAGYEVSVIALKRSDQKCIDIVDGVRVYRVPTLELFKKTALGELGRVHHIWLKLKSFLAYCVEYAYFTTACLLYSILVF